MVFTLFQQLRITPSQSLLVVLYAVLLVKIVGIKWIHDIAGGYLPSSEVEAAGTRVPQTFSVPQLRPVRTFIENTAHYQISGDDAEWAALIPGDGVVYIGEGKDAQPYTISIYHQLRCLDIIRKGIVSLEANTTSGVPKNSLTPLTHHCVNYLREMVLCRSDIDTDSILGRPKPAVTPDLYQCWDWEAVYTAVKDNQRAHMAHGR
ncbi:hypothetical protein BU17DRAFT_75563 [Hysterangium stoloniferum]|nr:hypothetical protein BU17DRAFT_75563 [Hysterangium stoloniferum]